MYFLSGFVINFVKQPLNSNNSDQEITTIQYKIRSGDTLWDIADNYNPSNKENFIKRENFLVGRGNQSLVKNFSALLLLTGLLLDFFFKIRTVPGRR